MSEQVNTQRPLFDAPTMHQTIKEQADMFQNNIEGSDHGYDRMGCAAKLMSGILSNAHLTGIYQREAVANISGGLSIPDGALKEDDGSKVRAIIFASVCRDALTLADQLYAADKYLEPGSMLLVPMVGDKPPPDSPPVEKTNEPGSAAGN